MILFSSRERSAYIANLDRELVEKGTAETTAQTSRIKCPHGRVCKFTILRREFAQPPSPQQREIGSYRERAQRMIGADVRSGLFAPDMLLARSQGQAKGAVAVAIAGLAHQPPRHLAQIGRAGSHKS